VCLRLIARRGAEVNRWCVSERARSGYATFTAAVSTKPDRRAHYDAADKYSNLFGAQYLFLVPAPGIHVHEVGGAWIRPYIPGRTTSALGDCGGS
jgi:hypothetical protein